MKTWIYLIILTVVVASCSSGRKALQKGDYIQAIEKAVNRLSNDPDNKKAENVLTDGYPVAMDYYQEQIDQILSGNDQFKWGQTLGIMQRVNHLGEVIRRVPAARKLVPSPKMYTSEIADVTNRAAEERYQAGLASLARPNRDDAREAFFNFQTADHLVPSYKDVLEKMDVAKDRATLKVIIEPIPLPSKRYALSADFFYNEVINKMDQQFPANGFVNFYSPDEADKQKIRHPDMVVRLEFYDFYVGKPNHFETQQKLDRVVEKEVKVKVGRDSVRIEKRPQKFHGKIKIATDEVKSGGLLTVTIEDFQAQKILINENVPGEFTWQNQYGLFVGDEEVLTDQQIQILNNKAVPPPAPQDMFIEFTRPIFAQLTDRLTAYFNRYK